MCFCNQLWIENQDIIQKIVSMDFLQDMFDGSLSDEKFYYYIEQDIHYLNDYAKANAYLMTKSENSEQLQFFLDSINASFEEQKRVHSHYTTQLVYSQKNTFTPAFKNYSVFILYHTASKSLPIGYASIMACPWLYVYLGEYFSAKKFNNNKYQYWFEANCTTEVQEWLSKQKKYLETFANNNPSYHKEMKKLFREALFLEYEFWNDAYLLKSI
ncbi:MAG: hypothetical protein KFW21_04985 [Spirochaetota bacterium]|nr:hypothetical protein [Spirochaetota bacterium]